MDLRDDLVHEFARGAGLDNEDVVLGVILLLRGSVGPGSEAGGCRGIARNWGFGIIRRRWRAAPPSK